MLQWLQNLGLKPTTVIFILMVTLSLLGQLVKKLGEMKKERERKEKARQAELEALRTGGRAEPVHTPMMPPAAPAPQRTARPSLEEIAEQRRRRIEELRSRKAAAPQPTPTPATATRTIRLPNGIVVQVPADPAPPPVPVPVPVRSAPKRQTPARSAPQRAPAPQPTPQRRRPEPEPAPVPAARTPTATRAAGFAAIVGKDRSSLRRAVVLSEVFGPPRSMQN